MGTGIWREKMLCFILGILSFLTILLLTGATSGPQFGKFQMESIVRNNMVYIYVMDTTTGRVRWVDDMNTPFDEMKDE